MTRLAGKWLAFPAAIGEYRRHRGLRPTTYAERVTEPKPVQPRYSMTGSADRFWMCSLGLGGSPGDAPNSGLQNVVLLITQRCVGVCDSCTWLMTMAVPWTPSTTSKPMAATLLSSWKAAAACPAHGRRPRQRQREPATGANTLRLPQTPPR